MEIKKNLGGKKRRKKRTIEKKLTYSYYESDMRN